LIRINTPPSTVDDTPILPTDRFEPTGEWYYRILAITGRVLGDAATLHEALDKFNAWAQASAIVLGSYIVHQRKGGRS
jgi:hypothetical protein